MKSQKPVYNRPGELPNDISSPLIPVLISMIGHVVLIGLLILGPKMMGNFRPDMTPRVIDVTLISMAPGIKGGVPKSGSSEPSASRERNDAPSPPKAEKQSEMKAPEQKPPEPKPPSPKLPEPKPPEPKPVEPKPPVPKEPPKAPPEKEVISLAPTPVTPKVSLKKQSYDPAAVRESALNRIEKKVAETNPEQPSPNLASLNESMERIRKAVEKKEAAGTGEGKAGGSPTGQGRPGAGIAGGEGLPGSGPPGEGSGPEMIYRGQIANVIRQNWAYSEQLADKNKNLTAWVMLEILPDGKIKDFWFERRSGNAYLDDSVARAIQKSNPLPPFPPGIRVPSIHQGFRFTPMGMQ